MNKVQFDFTAEDWQSELRAACAKLTGDTSLLGCWVLGEHAEVVNADYCEDEEREWFVVGATPEHLIKQIEEKL